MYNKPTRKPTFHSELESGSDSSSETYNSANPASLAFLDDVDELINNPADPRRSFSAPPRVSFSRSVSQESDDSTPPTPDMKPSFSRTNTERTIFLDSVGLKVYREALIHADDVDKVEDFHKVTKSTLNLLGMKDDEQTQFFQALRTIKKSNEEMNLIRRFSDTASDRSLRGLKKQTNEEMNMWTNEESESAADLSLSSVPTLSVRALSQARREGRWSLFRLRLPNGEWVRFRPTQLFDFKQSSPRSFILDKVRWLYVMKNSKDVLPVGVLPAATRKMSGPKERSRRKSSLPPRPTMHRSPTIQTIAASAYRKSSSSNKPKRAVTIVGGSSSSNKPKRAVTIVDPPSRSRAGSQLMLGRSLGARLRRNSLRRADAQSSFMSPIRKKTTRKRSNVSRGRAKSTQLPKRPPPMLATMSKSTTQLVPTRPALTFSMSRSTNNLPPASPGLSAPPGPRLANFKASHTSRIGGGPLANVSRDGVDMARARGGGHWSDFRIRIESGQWVCLKLWQRKDFMKEKQKYFHRQANGEWVYVPKGRHYLPVGVMVQPPHTEFQVLEKGIQVRVQVNTLLGISWKRKVLCLFMDQDSEPCFILKPIHAMFATPIMIPMVQILAFESPDPLSLRVVLNPNSPPGSIASPKSPKSSPGSWLIRFADESRHNQWLCGLKHCLIQLRAVKEIERRIIGELPSGCKGIPTWPTMKKVLIVDPNVFYRHLSEVRVLFDKRVTANWLGDFLSIKKRFGSDKEKMLYQNVHTADLINRLIRKRPVVFFLRADKYTLRDGRQGSGGFELVGTDDEDRGELQLCDVLSYDEIQLSALMSVGGPTQFANKGDRRNEGAFEQTRHAIEREGIIVGSVGCRFEREDVMEHAHLLVTDRQNTAAKGYGPTGDGQRHALLKHWAKLYEISHFPLFETVHRIYTEAEELSRTKSGNDLRHHPVLERYAKIQSYGGPPRYLDRVLYRKRVEFSVWPLLAYANREAERRGTKAYVHVVGLGLGVWKVDNVQVQDQVDVYGSILSDPKRRLSHVSDVDFSYFQCQPVCGGCRDGEELGGVRIHFSRRDPAQKLTGPDAGKLLVAQYAWDGNAFPGNEYWSNGLSLSGDPAAASCSTIALIHNPEFNKRYLNADYTTAW